MGSDLEKNMPWLWIVPRCLKVSVQVGWRSRHVQLGLQVEPAGFGDVEGSGQWRFVCRYAWVGKISSLCAEGATTWRSTDVELVRGKPPGISVFDWSEAVSHGDQGRALDIVAKNLQTGEAPLRMLGAFLWQMRRMWKAQWFAAGGEGSRTGCSTGRWFPLFERANLCDKCNGWQEPHFRQAWGVCLLRRIQR